MLSRKLNSNWDIHFGYGLSDYVRDHEAVMQNVKSRLQLLFGEWFLDVEAGVPYLQELMVKPANLQLAESIIKQTIIDTDGVDELRSFDLVFNRDTRTIEISSTVSTVFDTANFRITI